MEFYRRNYIEGLFLSSGVVRNPDYTMERLTAIARDLRTVHRFNGYIHLKSIPGCSQELLNEAGRYADREHRDTQGRVAETVGTRERSQERFYTDEDDPAGSTGE